MIAVADRAGLEGRGVGAGARLGQAIARDRRHAGETRQPGPALLGRPMDVDDRGAHVVDRQEGRDRRAAFREGLEDQHGIEPAEAGSSQVLARGDAGEPQGCGSA